MFEILGIENEHERNHFMPDRIHEPMDNGTEEQKSKGAEGSESRWPIVSSFLVLKTQ